MNNSFLPITTPQETYRYSESMFKHLPKNTLKMIQNDLWYSKKDVIYPTGQYQRVHNSNDTTTKTDDNIDDRIDKSN